MAVKFAKWLLENVKYRGAKMGREKVEAAFFG